MKYIIIDIVGVFAAIGVKTDIEGYTINVLETVYPSDKELAEWNEKQSNEWIKTNNKRMQAICDFLNKQEK